MRTPFLVGIPLLLFGTGCTEYAPVPKVRHKSELVTCILDGEPTCELGKAPKLTVSLTNQTQDDIYLVGSLDGSSRKVRYPHCYFEITGPDGGFVEGRWIDICGRVNRLRVQDFIRVPPGESFDPYQRIDGYGFFWTHQFSPNSFRQPGVYRIRFVYAADSDDIGEWAGGGRFTVEENEEIVSLFRQVPKLNVRSDEFTLTVK